HRVNFPTPPSHTTILTHHTHSSTQPNSPQQYLSPSHTTQHHPNKHQPHNNSHQNSPTMPRATRSRVRAAPYPTTSTATTTNNPKKRTVEDEFAAISRAAEQSILAQLEFSRKLKAQQAARDRKYQAALKKKWDEHYPPGHYEKHHGLPPPVEGGEEEEEEEEEEEDVTAEAEAEEEEVEVDSDGESVLSEPPEYLDLDDDWWMAGPAAVPVPKENPATGSGSDKGKKGKGILDEVLNLPDIDIPTTFSTDALDAEYDFDDIDLDDLDLDAFSSGPLIPEVNTLAFDNSSLAVGNITTVDPNMLTLNPTPAAAIDFSLPLPPPSNPLQPPANPIAAVFLRCTATHIFFPTLSTHSILPLFLTNLPLARALHSPAICHIQAPCPQCPLYTQGKGPRNEVFATRKCPFCMVPMGRLVELGTFVCETRECWMNGVETANRTLEAWAVWREVWRVTEGRMMFVGGNDETVVVSNDLERKGREVEELDLGLLGGIGSQRGK
ncbi:hypothetical protein GE09DRAFT_1271952, partial [Coniochaeta sp. 2T2.1]